MNRLLAALSFLCVGVVSTPGLFLDRVSAQDTSDHLTVTQWVRPAVRGKFKAQVVVPVVGGMRVTETGADLALLLAMVSSLLDRPLPDNLVALKSPSW